MTIRATGPRGGIDWPTLALAVAVAVAFADSSIVVIALPELLGGFDTTIPRVAWVVTAYNLTLALAAFALMWRPSPRWAPRLARAGVALFALACLGCALAGDLATLIAARAVQGVGAALLLAGALPLLQARGRAAGDGARLWGVAAVVGAALGPALGGLLTELFDWRAIFIAQIPVALAGLVAAFAPLPAARAGEPSRVGVASAPPPGGWAPRLVAGVALGLVSAALVGALFLASVLVIDGWGHRPLVAAAVLSVLPLGAWAGGRLAARARVEWATGAGVVLVALALLVMALVARSDLATLAVALGLCGIGMGLCIPALTADTLRGIDPAGGAGWSVGIRHVGLVVGLVLLAPVLEDSLAQVSERAALVGAAHLVDAPLPIAQKVEVAVALNRALDRAPTGAVPDLAGAATAGGDADDPVRVALGRQLDALVAPAVTRGFRSSFILCALLGLMALAPLGLGYLLASARPPRGP